jgi:predicted kinase
MDLVYLAGAPAVGKSTLMARLTEGAERVARADVKLVPYDELRVAGEVVGAEIGKRRVNFPGTDSLAMNALPNVAKWLDAKMFDVVCAEGDRLTHVRFFGSAADAGYSVHVFLLRAPMSVLDRRCEARGSNQSRSWRLSRVTLGERVAAWAEAEDRISMHYLDSQRPVTELAEEVRRAVPAMEILRERVAG